MDGEQEILLEPENLEQEINLEQENGEQEILLMNENVLIGGGDSYYDASWVLTQAQATPEQYNELLEAANNNQRIVVVTDSEHYYVPEISADQDNITMALSLSQPSGGSVNVVAFEVNIPSDTYNISFTQGTFSGSDFAAALNLKPNRSELAAVAYDGQYSSLNNAPSVNDGVLTITENGNTLGTFSANSAFNETINIAVPTNTSELNNDSGFITSADTYYDASWLFNESTATTTHYNELKQAILDKKRIYVSQQSESYDALGKIYDDGTGNIAVTITVGTTDSYDGVDYASDIVAMFEIDGTTKDITTTVGNTNGAEFARGLDSIRQSIPSKTSDLTNDSGFVTNTDYANSSTGGVLKITNAYGTDVSANGELLGTVVSESDYSSMWNDALVSKGTLENHLDANYYNKTENNSFGGVMMPDTTNMTPIRTIEYDVSSNAYFTLASIPNNFTNLNEVNGDALFRITVTGTGLAVNVVECLWSLRQATNLMPFLIIRNKPGIGANAAADSGIRYLRYAYPRALNNGYSWDIDFNCINNDTRHIKIEIFNQTNNVQWNSILTQSDYNSTYQTGASLTLSTVDGISAVGTFQFTVSTATSSNYITSYLPKFPSGALPHAGQAILAQQFIFISPEDDLFYPSSNTTKTLDPHLGIQLSSNAVNLNSAVPNTGYRQKYNNATLTNIPHATLTAGDRCFFRCTMDSNGGIHSDNYVATAMTPGYTWYFVGIATSATAINIDTTQSMFYTLDANGKLTHINGLEIA